MDLSLRGGSPTQTSGQYSYIWIRLEECKSQSSVLSCKSQDEIDRFFSDIRFNIYYVNQMLQFKDFSDNPVKKYVQDPAIQLQLKSWEEQEAQILVSQAKTEFMDHYFMYWQKISQYFIQVDKVHLTSFKLNSNKALASAKIRLDNTQVIYGRVADNLFSALESIGGFHESLMHIGFMAVIFFQERLFKSSFLRQLYQVGAELKPTAKKFSDAQMVKVVNENEELEENFLKSIVDYLLQRTRFSYGYREITHYLVKCRCFTLQKSKKNLSKNDKQHFLYNKGNEKLERELDVVNLVKSIRQLRLMAQVLLSQNERILLKFQRQNMIELTSSSSDSDDHRYDTVKLLNSKKDLDPQTVQKQDPRYS
ncbi:hypothetical protein FGO68_gene5339 [Halteria grandinella]|uniref:Uncharacterized protein n=1 Tax=Halteria grandinella TaxID=5974 RepID=A0A8J8P128_HALGN|nr:hypothetical protein FGO68_gene5339 [Halteria grandinella]